MTTKLDTSSPPSKPAPPSARRKTNRWAIACVVGGLLSVLALRHPAFLVIPGLTVVIGALALGTAIRSRQTVWAVPLLAVGLLLAAGFGGAAARSMRGTDPVGEAGARQFTEYWMSLLHGGKDMTTAFILMAEPSRRPPPGTDLKAFVQGDADLRQALHRFYEDEFVRLLRMGLEAEYNHEKTVLVNKRRGDATFWYHIEYTDFAGKRRQARAEVVLHYQFGDSDKPSGWWVEIANLPIGFRFIERPD